MANPKTFRTQAQGAAFAWRLEAGAVEDLLDLIRNISDKVRPRLQQIGPFIFLNESNETLRVLPGV
jgi:hypothetical protein